MTPRLLLILSLALLAPLAMAAPSVPAMPAWEAARATSTPTLDGRLDDPCWQGLAAAGGFRDAATGAPASPATTFTLVYDDASLYLGVACQAPVAEGERLHLLLDPGFSRQAWAHLRLSPAGEVDDAWETAQAPADPDWQSGAAVATSLTESGWFAEVRIPFASLRYTVQPRAPWGLNVARESGPAGLSSWAPGDGPALAALRPLGRLSKLDPAFPALTVAFGTPRLGEPAVAGDAFQARLILPYRSRAPRDLNVAVTAIFEAPDGSVERTSLTATLRPGADALKPLVEVGRPGLNQLHLEVRRLKPDTLLLDDRFPVTLDYEPVSIILQSPAYRDSLYAASSERQISGLIKLDLPRGASGAEVQISLSSGATQLAALPARRVAAVDEVPFAFAAESLAAGDYTVLARVLRQGAEVARAERVVRRLKARDHEVLIGPGGRLQVGSLTFTPLAITGTSPEPSLAGAGLNTLVLAASWWATHTAADLPATLDAARDCGLRVIVAPSAASVTPGAAEEGTPLSAADLDAATAVVQSLRQHPALIAWLVADTPRGALLADSLRRLYLTIAGLDPSHPCVVLDDDPRSLASLADCADVLCLTVDRRDLGQPPALTAALADLRGATGKPVWFSPRSDAAATPSVLRELRCLHYLALLSGATGALLSADAPAALTSYRECLGPEMVLLAPVLHEGAPATDLGVRILRGKSLDAAAWRLGDADFIVAVNSAATPVRARLTLPGIGDRRLRVLSEDRFVEPRDQSITDDFAPFAVHLYTNGRRLPALLPLEAVERHIANDQAASQTAW